MSFNLAFKAIQLNNPIDSASFALNSITQSGTIPPFIRRD